MIHFRKYGLSSYKVVVEIHYWAKCGRIIRKLQSMYEGVYINERILTGLTYSGFAAGLVLTAFIASSRPDNMIHSLTELCIAGCIVGDSLSRAVPMAYRMLPMITAVAMPASVAAYAMNQ